MQEYNYRFQCFNRRKLPVIRPLMSLRQFLISARLLRSQGGGYLRVICIVMKGDIVKPIWLKRGKRKVTPTYSKPQVTWRWKMNDCRLELQKLKASQRYKQNQLGFGFRMPIHISNDQLQSGDQL